MIRPIQEISTAIEPGGPAKGDVRLVIALGLAHGVSDAAAGFILGMLSRTLPLATWQIGLLVLLYNTLAFGGQPIAGLLIDRLRLPKLAAVSGLVVMGFALALAGWQPALVVGLGLAGIGSALYHAGGGGLVLCATPKRALGPGVFTAPGVIGLAIGGALATQSGDGGAGLSWLFIVALLALAAMIAIAAPPALLYPTDRTARDEPLLNGHEFVLLLLLAAIALRSIAWNAVEYLHEGQIPALLALALAAGAGKLLGGIIADRIGWRLWATAALCVAAPLLVLGSNRPELLLIGAALLQSVTPVALALMGEALPRQPATAAGMALGLGIVVGGAPLIGGLAPLTAAPAVLVVTALLAGMIMWAITGDARRSFVRPRTPR